MTAPPSQAARVNLPNPLTDKGTAFDDAEHTRWGQAQAIAPRARCERLETARADDLKREASAAMPWQAGWDT